jgi:ribosomal protein L11 methyltransferase
LSGATFRFRLKIPRRLSVEGRTLDRDAFYSWLWERFSTDGLAGVHEGTLLSEEAVTEGLETESWTVDSGEAPRERDWVAAKSESETEVYFSDRESAERACDVLRGEKLEPSTVEEVPAQDWDVEWKASFTGAEVPPFWHVLPPWREPEPGSKGVVLRVNPGAGFGTGTHETTQLCLRLLGELGDVRGWKTLDFGSGSGILAIGAALLGAEVEGVEIDPLAIENSQENARLNGLDGRIDYARALRTSHRGYRLILANILKPVLLEFAETLVSRLEPGGRMILSGLVDKDVAPVTEKYSPLLDGKKPRVLELGEWRALAF